MQGIVDRLATADWKDRERLTTELVEIGDLAVPPLQERLNAADLDPQVRVSPCGSALLQ